eukprot:6332370-Heterocapsa_arctica.AAC.1
MPHQMRAEASVVTHPSESAYLYQLLTLCVPTPGQVRSQPEHSISRTSSRRRQRSSDTRSTS